MAVSIEELIDEQVSYLDPYGGVGVEEACSPEFLPDLEKADKLSEENKKKIVAIAAIINGLIDIADDILDGKEI